MKAFFFSAALTVAFTQAAAQSVALLCRANIDGRPALVKVLKVDYSKRTVDDVPAVVTDVEVTWTSADSSTGRVRYVDHTLNRIAGTYSFWGRGEVYASMPPLYTCEKAPPAKF